MKLCETNGKNRAATRLLYAGAAYAGAALLTANFVAGCSGATRLATEALAGKTVAEEMSKKSSRETSANEALDESKRQNADARVGLGVHLQTTWMEFRSQPRQMRALQPAVWTLNIWQAGKIAKNRNWSDEFKYSREKLMHLVVISKDLTYFNHIFPDYRGDGLFIASQTLPRGGNYKIYVDYTPQEGVQEVAQHDFRVLDAPDSTGKSTTNASVTNASATNASAKIVPDVAINGFINRRVVAKPEGQPEAEGGEIYNVAMTAPRFVVGKTATLQFRLSDAQNRPVFDSAPYLGAAGYVAILSADTKIYLNARALDSAPNAPNATSSTRNAAENGASANGATIAFETEFPAPGIYKIWAQFQHNDRVITAPFVFDVAAK